MENKNRNLLLLGLAGIGIYYFLKNKNRTALVVPPTTGELQPPMEQIKTPVEPVYTPPVFEERDPIYSEPIYNNPRIDTPPIYTPERGKIEVPPPSIVQQPIYDYVQPPASIWDFDMIDDPNERIKTPVEPVYTEPIYQEQIYRPEPIYQPEPTPYYESNVEYGGSVTDFANNIPFLGMLYERDEPVEYDFEQKRR